MKTFLFCFVILLMGVGFAHAQSGTKTVIVSWTTKDTVVVGGVAPAGFRIGIALQETTAALSARSHTFTGVEPGVMAIYAVLVDATGKELSKPITGSVTVPQDAVHPIPVTISGSVQ